MKKSIIASGLIALLALTTGCDKYEIYPESYDGVFTIRNAGTKDLTVYATDNIAEVPFIVMKGGYKPEVTSTATLKVMSDEEFADYQEKAGNLPYVAVGSNCYSFSPELDEDMQSIDYVFGGKDDKSRTSHLYVRPNVLREWLQENAELVGDNTPVIPVMLVSETDKVDVNSNISIIKLNVRVPVLSIDAEEVNARTINASTIVPGEDNRYTPEANFSMPCANPWGFTLNVASNNTAVAKYNMVNGTSFLVLPADTYELETSYHFEPGVTSMPLKLSIDVEKLDILRTYALAVTINKKNPITWDDENNNPGDALEVEGGKTVIFTVRVMDIVTLQKVELSTANVTTNDQEPTEGQLAGLFDGNTETYFHSGWSVANERESTYASYLEIELPKPMSMFRFNMTTRKSPTAAGYVKTVHIFGTNDKNNWPTTPFAVITDMNQILNGSAVSGEFGTDEEPYRANDNFKYLRFCVMESGGGSLGSTTGSIYWCASEFELYGF